MLSGIGFLNHLGTLRPHGLLISDGALKVAVFLDRLDSLVCVVLLVSRDTLPQAGFLSCTDTLTSGIRFAKTAWYAGQIWATSDHRHASPAWGSHAY